MRGGGIPVVDESVASKVRIYLETLQAAGIPVRFGVVFGSQATGRANRWSDIDLVVVSPRFDLGAGRAVVAELWRLAARVDSRIEPIPCGERRWSEDDSSPVLEMARREGQTLFPAAQPPAKSA
jgi:predicted nucleotidyltransferase